jgi:transcriptional regulator with XRE-family HTH domain
MAGKGRGGGKTPERVVELVNKAVSEKSLRAVSKETGLGIAALSRYSQGIGEPSQATLEKLADYFEVTVPELRGELAFNSELVGNCLDEINDSVATLKDKIGPNKELVQILKSTKKLVEIFKSSKQKRLSELEANRDSLIKLHEILTTTQKVIDR